MRDTLRALGAGEPVGATKIAECAKDIMSGNATDAQIAAFLMLLKMKGETADEMAAFSRALLDCALPCAIEDDTVDIVGTGGDGHNTFNVSTASGIIAASTRLVKVSKHGNRSSSSGCGSADVIEASGCKLDIDTNRIRQAINETGFAFVFARSFHPAMKRVGALRKEIGVRTIFNIMGPLINPSRPRYMIVGVYKPELAPHMARALLLNGVERALVVCAENGLDEISPCGFTRVWEVTRGTKEILESRISPADFGLEEHSLEAVVGGQPNENAATLKSLCAGTAPAAIVDWVTLNAGALLVVSGKAGTYKEAAGIIQQTISSGKAATILSDYARITNLQ